MPRRVSRLLLAVLLWPAIVAGQTSTYRLSFPEPERQWMQVELHLDGLPASPLELLMSRASPGRYALHDFVRGVAEVTVTDGAGLPLSVSRPAPDRWLVAEHGSVVRVRYRVSGNRADGTYLGIDASHAHINMPAALIWARGLESRPFTVQVEPPAGRPWRVATQLFPGSDERTFTAPNLQYLMDSPTEVSAFDLRTFTLSRNGSTFTFRFAAHHEGTTTELDQLVADTERIVRETEQVFGEFPSFDTGTYTFIADYLPSVVPDGMEHRNSTVLTSRSSIGSARLDLLGTIAHEFFHAWNVERIRPKSLEPFRFDAANPSGELWLAEGFTQYYGALLLARAGLLTPAQFADEIGGMVGEVLASPARRQRSLEAMSLMAVEVDGPSEANRARRSDGFLSYYTWGGALALGLDLTLRERSDGRVTLDDLMRRLWVRHGRPGGAEPGLVSAPYTLADVEVALAEVSGSARFARTFLRRYVRGSAIVDYRRLLAAVGFQLRESSTGGYVVAPIEADGGVLQPAARARRQAWLASRQGGNNTPGASLPSGSSDRFTARMSATPASP